MHSTAPDQQVMNDAYDHALWLRRLESPLDARDRQLCDLGHYVSQLLAALEKGQENCDAVYNDLRAENTKLHEAFKCFRCGDGHTPLYCLNCAEKMNSPQIVELP